MEKFPDSFSATTLMPHYENMWRQIMYQQIVEVANRGEETTGFAMPYDAVAEVLCEELQERGFTVKQEYKQVSHYDSLKKDMVTKSVMLVDIAWGERAVNPQVPLTDPVEAD